MASAEEDFIMLSTVETSFGEDLDLGLDSEFLKVVTKKEKRPIWSEKEVSTLLNIMIEKRILNLLDGEKYKRNDIFKLVQNNLQKKGFNRTTIQICNKWKQLKSVYAETKRANSKSGGSRTECPHFSSLEELLGARPTQTLEGIDSGSAAAPSNLTTAGQQASSEPDPEFLAALENHTVTQGRDVSFTCVVNHLGTYKVAWIKSDSKAILAIHTHLVAHNNRLSVTHNGHNTWKLHVSNVQKNDSGTYMCQINTDPMRSQMGNLEVLIPPDIINEDLTDALAAPEGGSVKLRCRATGIPEPTVVWRREDSASIVLRQETAREKQVVRSYDGETLLLSNIQRTDMGPYLCIASNGVPPTVSKRFNVQVHFHPVMKVSNQLVAAPVGSDVVIQCFVETSPKAMHSWFKDSGEKLMPGSKYDMQEVLLNAYSLMLNLTIRDLERRDFGGYVCSSVNALGKAEGVIRLQELSIPTKATVVPSPTYNDYNKVRKKQHSSHSKGGKPGRRGNQGPKQEGESESADRASDDLGTTAVVTGPPTTPASSRQPPPFTLHGDSKAMAAHSTTCTAMQQLTITLLLACYIF